MTAERHVIRRRLAVQRQRAQARREGACPRCKGTGFHAQYKVRWFLVDGELHGEAGRVPCRDCPKENAPACEAEAS
jgi:hypothetical protein